jgi:hypothetical protein
MAAPLEVKKKRVSEEAKKEEDQVDILIIISRFESRADGGLKKILRSQAESAGVLKEWNFLTKNPIFAIDSDDTSKCHKGFDEFEKLETTINSSSKREGWKGVEISGKARVIVVDYYY